MKTNRLRPALCIGTAIALMMCALGCGSGDSKPKPSGTLGFVSSGSYAASPSPLRVVVADFNGDGKTDLAITISEAAPTSAKSMTILLGNGDGTFRVAPAFAVTGQNINNAAVGDFNGDGKPDLAMVLPSLNEVQVLLGNGDGTFEPSAPIFIPNGATSVATGDFNGDGNADLVVAPDYGTELTVLSGDGKGAFTPTSVAPAFEIADVEVGDFNRDGISDLAVQSIKGNVANSWVTILLGNRDGTFTPTQSLALENLSSYMAVGDFTGSGVPDLAGSAYVAGSCPSQGTMSVLVGTGNGAFTQGPDLQAGMCPGAVVVGDFNGDGKADLATLSYPSTITVFLGNGDGTFSAPLSFPENWNNPVGLAVGDFNGDGLSDLAVTDPLSNSVTILLAHLTPVASATAKRQ